MLPHTNINQGKQDNCYTVMMIRQEISFQIKILSGCSDFFKQVVGQEYSCALQLLY